MVLSNLLIESMNNVQRKRPFDLQRTSPITHYYGTPSVPFLRPTPTAVQFYITSGLLSETIGVDLTR